MWKNKTPFVALMPYHIWAMILQCAIYVHTMAIHNLDSKQQVFFFVVISVPSPFFCYLNPINWKHISLPFFFPLGLSLPYFDEFISFVKMLIINNHNLLTWCLIKQDVKIHMICNSIQLAKTQGYIYSIQKRAN